MRRRRFVVLNERGPGCPRCGRPMQVREHDRIREKQLRQPFYYSRWFRCMHKGCKRATAYCGARAHFAIAAVAKVLPITLVAERYPAPCR